MAKNRDKNDPHAYCATIRRKTEDGLTTSEAVQFATIVDNYQRKVAELNGQKRVQKPSTSPTAGGAGSQVADPIDYINPRPGEPGSIQGKDDNVPHGKFNKRAKPPRAGQKGPSVPPSYAPKDPVPPGGETAGDTRDRALRPKPYNPDDDIAYPGEQRGDLPGDTGRLSRKAIDREPENPDETPPEESHVCMCGPRKELEKYFQQENLQPVHFSVHISESSLQKIPYWARILAAFPTKSLNGRIYRREVLNDAAAPYVGQPFILDHDYEDSFKVQGKVIASEYGVKESPYMGKEAEGLWLDVLGLMDQELVELVQGDQEHGVPPLIRGVSIGGEGDAEPTRDGMVLKKFYPTEISMTAFPGIPGAHIADFQTITESYKSANRNSPRMSIPGTRVENENGVLKVHVPDVVGLANSRGLGGVLENQLGINQDVRAVGGDPRTGLTVEGPMINSPDGYRRPITDQVPFIPQSTARSPIDMANPSFSGAPRATGYALSTDSQAGQPWRSEKRFMSMKDPNPIRDGKEEEEETARHYAKMAQIYAKRAGGNRELGPVASDGSTVHGIAGTHKHLPPAAKPDFKMAAGVGTQHTAQGAKIEGQEAQIDVGKPKPEEEEEERMKQHGNLTCEQAHGVMPHSVWMDHFTPKTQEGTEPLTPSDQFRGPPKYDWSNTSARQAAFQVGTTSSEAKSPEEEEEAEEENYRHNMTLMAIHRKFGNSEAKSPEEEEEEEEENHVHARALINIRKYFRSQEGTAQPPAQGRGVPVPGYDKQEEEERRRQMNQGAPFGANYTGEASNMPNLTPRYRDLGSGVVSVTVGSLPPEYQMKLTGMAEGMRRVMGIHPSRDLGESYRVQQPIRESYAPRAYRENNRYPTIGFTGLPPLPQQSVSRSAGTSINGAVAQMLGEAKQYAGNTQDALKIAWNNLASGVISEAMGNNANAYLRGRRWR